MRYFPGYPPRTTDARRFGAALVLIVGFVPTADGAEPNPPSKIVLPAPTPVELKVPPLAKDTTELKLPGTVTDTAVGGGGRYWCLLIPELKQIAIFDANAGKVAKYIRLTDRNACMAAGMNKLLVVYPDTETVVRYDLATFEEEKSDKLPFRGTVRQMCLGSASAGPMLVAYAKGTGPTDRMPATLLDIVTFKEYDISKPGGRARALSCSVRDSVHFRASPDGRVYGAWITSHTPTGFNVLAVSESGLTGSFEGTSVGQVVPAGNGWLLTKDGAHTPDLKRFGSKGEDGARVPAPYGDWYMLLTSKGGERPVTRVRVCRTNDTTPFLDLGEIGFALGSDAWTKIDLTQDKRVLFSPEVGLIAWLGSANDRMSLRKFDLQAELDKSGGDYFLVVGRPPAAAPGKRFAYKPDVRTKKGGAKVKLDGGPAGMTVADDGTLSWDVPADWAGRERVYLSVTDAAGRLVYHAFDLVVPGSTAAPKP